MAFLMTLAVCSILALFTAWLLVKPHCEVQISGPTEQDSSLEVCIERRDRCLQVLRDLELDYQTKKIADSDYQQMRVTLSQELAAILQTIDGLSSPAK